LKTPYNEEEQKSIQGISQQKMTKPPSANATTIAQNSTRIIMSVFLNTVLRGMKALPHTWSWWKAVEVIKNVSYGDSNIAEHKLDIYRPINNAKPSPVVFHIHGGGFSILSKDTHWMAALLLAKQGYTVFTINYRLAQTSPCPAAVQDTFQAAKWVHANAEKYGADNSQWFVIGESAGGNLTLGLTLASCFQLESDWAREIFDLNLPIKACIPACGYLQVSNPERFMANKKISKFILSRILSVSKRYLRDGVHALADPLLILESEQSPDRPIPPIMAFVGTRDPILDDTRRLETALKKRNIEHRIDYYPGAVHGFHLALWKKDAKRCWQTILQFMNNQTELVDRDAEN